MSRIAKWKPEKTKVKVVFRLQFHATHIPQAGWDKLFISFIPADSGKVTAKTTKANVRAGTCKWADPIYETTRLLQDTKTKQYDEKLYKLVVAMGSSRSSMLGEAIINLADYADALKPFVASLPLNGCDSAAVLHVTVQLLTSKTGFREFEQQRELRERGFTDQNSPDESSRARLLSSEEALNNQTDKIQSKVKLKDKLKKHPSIEEDARPNGEYPDSAVGFDGSSNTSGSLNAERHETSSINEIDSLKSMTSGDVPGLSQSPQDEKGYTSEYRPLARVTNEWVHGWSLDHSADNDVGNAIEENIRLRGFLDMAESSFNDLKMEVSFLQRGANKVSSEAQNFVRILSQEMASGEQLIKEVSLLKSECSKLKEDLEHLRTSKSCASFTSSVDQDRLFHDVQRLWLNGLLVVEGKIKELQNKACFGYHDKDSRFLSADLEVLLGALLDLKQEVTKPVSTRELVACKPEQLTSEIGFGTDISQPELGPLHYPGIPGLASQDLDSADSANAMKAKFFDLLRELDESKVERQSLVKKMDQMECYYEGLVLELEESQRQMLGQLQSLRTEHSTCLYTLNSANTEIEAMRQTMNEQISRFTEEKHSLDSMIQQLEKRAHTAETALKRARLNYSIAVKHLQKDLELLSSQVVSMYDTNENLIKQAFPDSSQACSQVYPEIVQNLKSDQKVGVRELSLGGDVLLEDLKRSLHVQEGLYQKVETELNEMHSENIYLDVFSKILLNTLFEASDDVSIMKDKINELTWQLELSNEAKELIKQRLDCALDDVCVLNEGNAAYIAKCNDMTLRNQELEESLQIVTHENHNLGQNVAEMESRIIWYKSYESKYEACVAEKTELSNSLEKEAAEKGNLQKKISHLQMELEEIKTRLDDLASKREVLQNNINSLKNKLQSLLESYSEKLNGVSCSVEAVNSNSECEELEALALKLEKLQCNAYETILQLSSENNDLVDERNKTCIALSAVESNMMQIKQKNEHAVHNMADKLEASSALVEKLGSDVEALACRVKVGSEVEKKFEESHKELIRRIDYLETEVQQLLIKNGDLNQEIMALGALATELETNKLALENLTVEKQSLMASLQDKSEESSRFAIELDNLRGSFESLNEELKENQRLRDILEGNIEYLTSQLDEKHLESMNFDDQKSELVRLKHIVSDLESEKSRQSHLLSMHGESLRKESLRVSDLESQLSETFEFSVAADVQHIYMRTQYEVYVEELVQQVNCSNRCLAMLQKKHLKVETALSHQNANEAWYIEENARLLTSVDSLRSELKIERSLRDELEGKLEELNSQLRERHLELRSFDEQKSELDSLKEMVSHLQLEQLNQSQQESLCVTELKSQLSEIFEFSLAADIQFIFARTQSEVYLEDLLEILSYSDRCHGELKDKNFDLETRLSCCLANEAQFKEENARLMTNLDALRSDLETSMAENRVLLCRNTALKNQLENGSQVVKGEKLYSDDITQFALEVDRLKNMLANYEEEIENLIVLKEELGIEVEVLKAKAYEQKAQIKLLAADNDGLELLQKQCNELKHKLSEQVLKTEEFKNLSIHLKELKDKAETESSESCEKKPFEGAMSPAQESLRIIFIKEQYETKLQELRHQLSMSQKHSEEILLKLQDALDEIEARGRSEASQIKRNEELGQMILDLEAELQAVVSDKREKAQACDVMKAELDCSLLSLECCKEEKQKLEVSLHECNQEKLRISTELSVLKALVESSRTCSDLQNYGRTNGELIHVDREHCADAEHTSTVPSAGSEDHIFQDVIQPRSLNGKGSQSPSERETTSSSDREDLAVINDNFRAQTLRSSLDHLNNELEKMRKENLLDAKDDHDLDEKFPGLEREVMQLRKVNEELKAIFPLFEECPGYGNALERVLALEIELAEALRSKKKSSINFQSSFLKQHSDDESILQSFRDINDLIEEMLEMKGRYTALETELRDMHDRYSQLSLQFAEVEGERQKLMMTLRNVRASKKGSQLNCSSPASTGEKS